MFEYDYTENENICQDTWLKLGFINWDDISADIAGGQIPMPHTMYMRNEKMFYCFLIKGFFKTYKSSEYINDIIARFIITYGDTCFYSNLNEFKHNEEKYTARELKEFQNLKSRAMSIINHRTQYDHKEDFVFWCLKLRAEDHIREKGIVVFDDLLEYAYRNFMDTKAGKSSSLKSKCRSIVKFYIKNNYTIPRNKYIKKDQEEVMATRKEQALRISRERAAQVKRKVISLTTGLFKDEYKTKSGKWHISKIAKEAGVSRNSVMKYLYA